MAARVYTVWVIVLQFLCDTLTEISNDYVKVCTMFTQNILSIYNVLLFNLWLTHEDVVETIKWVTIENCVDLNGFTLLTESR